MHNNILTNGEKTPSSGSNTDKNWICMMCVGIKSAVSKIGLFSLKLLLPKNCSISNFGLQNATRPSAWKIWTYN
jgi:hypothetical protein